jgi:hypothetical protein
MRRVILLSLSFVLIAAAPLFAGETLTLYDNFNSALINPTKWTGSASDVLELHRYIVFPAVGDGELHLEARGYGFRTSAAANDARSGNNRLRFRRLDPNVVRAIKATVKVNNAVAVPCPTAGSEVTQARFRLFGYFFNDGTGEPGRATGDVQARIEIRRLSTEPSTNKKLNVRALVFRCHDPDCTFGQTLSNQTLGTINVGTTATLLLQWDRDTNRFLFRLNTNPQKIYTYTLPDTAPPQNFFDKKYIDVSHLIGNCVATQTYAFMSVNVDDVFLNTAALAAASEAMAGVAPVTEWLPGSEPSLPEPDDMGEVIESEPDVIESDE